MTNKQLILTKIFARTNRRRVFFAEEITTVSSVSLFIKHTKFPPNHTQGENIRRYYFYFLIKIDMRFKELSDHSKLKILSLQFCSVDNISRVSILRLCAKFHLNRKNYIKRYRHMSSRRHMFNLSSEIDHLILDTKCKTSKYRFKIPCSFGTNTI